MFKGKFFSGGNLWKPKNPHSLEYLKYLHGVLLKNETVTDQNRSMLVEVLRAISEILIWGDQHDSTVFESVFALSFRRVDLLFSFFLEKQMLSYFLQIMRQQEKCGSYVCVQLLQTLNILFENIRHETSLYFLLSNNHVNSIITHRFDFSDEEILAYYISFLKTLSLKLDNYTIHFFFNEQTNDFPLYTEAIKFFNHSECMVRIAVRTLTLNVYRVNDSSMLKFIRDVTAAPYFSNFVWFIGNHVVATDTFIQAENASRDRLDGMIAEHLDHIHYVNDILGLKIDQLNDLLTDQLLRRLLVPVYLGSLAPQLAPATATRVSRVSALFLLGQVFLVISDAPTVEQLLTLLLFGDADDLLNVLPTSDVDAADSTAASSSTTESADSPADPLDSSLDVSPRVQLDALFLPQVSMTSTLGSRPLYASLLMALDCTESDHAALFGLILLYAILRNDSVPAELMAAAELPNDGGGGSCERRLLDALLAVLACAASLNSAVRVVTVELCCLALRQLLLVDESADCEPHERIRAQLDDSKRRLAAQLADAFATDELFLDLFDDEYDLYQRRSLKVHLLSADPALLLPPAVSPFSGVNLVNRLPCGPQECTRRICRIFFVIRQFLLDLTGEADAQLPLSSSQPCVLVNDCINLSNSDLLSCTVALKNNVKQQRFLVVDGLQLILVEPDSKRVAWGVVKFVGFLQDIEISGDKDDSRVLHVTVHNGPSRSQSTAQPLLLARFIFDDHIRCMAAKQRLTKGKQRARQFKMGRIATLLEIDAPPSASPRRNRSPLKSRIGTAELWPGYASAQSRGDASSNSSCSGDAPPDPHSSSDAVATPPPPPTESEGALPVCVVEETAVVDAPASSVACLAPQKSRLKKPIVRTL